MLTGSYRKRLEADLVRWVGEGLVSADSAAIIRRALAQEGSGFKLPALLGLFGGLLIASSVSAFVAANWEEIPRIVKLVMILLAVAGALGISARLESRGSTGGADAAATCGTLIFAAGVALGALALDRGGPGLLTAFLPWGLIGLILSLNVELARILEPNEARPGTAFWLNYFAYALALPAVVGLGLLARERRFAWPLAVALIMSLLVPVLFWSGGAVSMAGKILVAALILAIALGIVVAGAGGGVRRLSIAGSTLFAIAVVILLWQTIGTLLDQSLFFLVGGAALIAIASGMRRLLAKFGKPTEAAP